MLSRRTCIGVLLLRHAILVESLEIFPTSLTVNTETVINFLGVNDGDQIEFTQGSCPSEINPSSTVGPSATVRNSRATLKLSSTVEYKLCLESHKGGVPIEQSGVTLKVVSSTPSTAITSITRSKLARGRPASIRLNGAKSGSKAYLIPSVRDCSSETPDVMLDANLQGTFVIPSFWPIGQYQLCYQQPHGSDSIKQTNAGVQLLVTEWPTTEAQLISSIEPTEITVNVSTVIKFDGASPGDTADFINDDDGECRQITPRRDVGSGQAMFTFTSTGSHTLCYRVYGAAVWDSVAQTSSGTKLKVRSPGLSVAMMNRWQSKNGNVDCNALSYVAYCGAADESECPNSYMVKSGIGYTCSWESSRWPPRCETKDASDQNSICKSGTCANSACW